MARCIIKMPLPELVLLIGEMTSSDDCKVLMFACGNSISVSATAKRILH